MTLLPKTGLLLFLLLVLASDLSYCQILSHKEKLQLADSVRTIKVWTYIKGDSTYSPYLEAIPEIRLTLGNKGYQFKFLTFTKADGISPEKWKNGIISNLKISEAFLEVTTQITVRSGDNTQNRTINYVVDPSGASIYNRNQNNSLDTVHINYSCFAEAELYVNWKNTLENGFAPVYSKIEKQESNDIRLMVKWALTGIPGSKHPIHANESATMKEPEKTRIEFTGSIGFMFASTMDVAEGSTILHPGVARFHANAPYGLELGIELNTNFDVTGGYQRMGTMINVNTPKLQERKSIPTNESFILVGGNYNYRANKLLSPYIGASIGAFNNVPKDDYFREVWYFATGLHGGIKFYLSKRFGFRIQAEALYIIHPDDAPFLYSMETFNVPCNAFSDLLQISVNGGVILRIGN
ncbi:MAG: hypothetical protein NTX61_17770 [Bacteroidetes bacterium]|nr:hypothetical protein [Bacteroidota bacterium]